MIIGCQIGKRTRPAAARSRHPRAVPGFRQPLPLVWRSCSPSLPIFFFTFSGCRLRGMKLLLLRVVGQVSFFWCVGAWAASWSRRIKRVFAGRDGLLEKRRAGPWCSSLRSQSLVHWRRPPTACPVAPNTRRSQSTDPYIFMLTWIPPNSSTDDTVWSVTAGKLKASPGAIVWDFLGVPAGIYQAEAKRRGNEGAPPICVVEVVALERTRTTEATLRSFLIRGDSEPDGYSLYSYLLLGSRPSESNRTKYIHAIEAVLQYSYTANELSSIFDPGQLNLTTIPVTGKPPADAAAKWVLDNYDFGRARAFLTKLGGSRLDGPYIVSATMPIMKSTPPYLFEDLSLVPEEPPQLVSWWVREFINQSSQRTQWNGAKLELFGLRIRTTIAILANAAPAVRDGFRKWVSVIK